MKGIATALLLLLSTVQICRAQDLGTGNIWFERCTRQIPSDCISFIEGVAETHNTLRLAGILSENQVYCTPKGVTFGQMMDIAVAYMRNNPQKRHYRFVNLVLGSLREAFPCPN